MSSCTNGKDRQTGISQMNRAATITGRADQPYLAGTFG
ncbi:MAG: hypothetical protein OJF51_003652 [Nitrospira sp.]|nr:MAG: hypothetical protein OJF51_003652 [Nitrospira sp.]